MSKQTVFSVFILIAFMLSCDTQSSFVAPDQNYFLKYYGNSGDQRGVDMIVNPDGTFVLLGNSKITSSATDQQIYVAKADAKGNLLWEKTYGGPNVEEARDLELLPDGNLLVLANTEVSAGNRDVYLIKLSQSGDVIKESLPVGFQKSNGDKTDEDASRVTVTSRGYMVAGSTSYVSELISAASDVSDPIQLLFLNDLTFQNDIGEWQSKPAFDNSGYIGEERTIKIVEFDPTTFYAFGYTNLNKGSGAPVSNFKFAYYEIGSTGIGSNLKQIDLSVDQKLFDCSIIPPELGSGYFLSGISSTGDIFVTRLKKKLNPNNNGSDVDKLQTNLTIKDFGFSTLQRTNSWSSSLLTRGTFIASEKLVDNRTNIYLTKIDENGVKVFEQSFGGVGDDLSSAVVELADGRVALMGTMTLGGVVDGQKKIVLMKLNSQGRLAP